jgi:hypothetical protein
MIPPLQLQAIWNLIWPQIQADIMAHIGDWRTSRHNRTMYRVPPYVINWAALNVPPALSLGCPISGSW